MRLLISQWNEETNLSLQPPQVRVITVLNTHGFLKRLMTNIIIYYRHIIVSPCMDITALLYWNAHNIDLCNRSLQPSQVSIVAENVLWQVVQLVVTQVPVRKIDTSVFNTYGSQYSWQIFVSRDYKPLLFLSKVYVSPSHEFFASRMKKWKYESTVVK